VLKLEASELGENEMLACVSHYFTIRNVTASKYDKYGKPTNGLELGNCEYSKWQI
jgi:hypothetical protein